MRRISECQFHKLSRDVLNVEENLAETARGEKLHLEFSLRVYCYAKSTNHEIFNDFSRNNVFRKRPPPPPTFTLHSDRKRLRGHFNEINGL